MAQRNVESLGSSPVEGRLPRVNLAALRRLSIRLGARGRSIAADLSEEGARIALVLVASIVIFAIMGAIETKTHSPSVFDLNGEQHFDTGVVSGINLPALFSGAVLFVAAGFGIAAARVERQPWIALATLFAFMGVDEVMKIHESLDHWLSVPWQILYIPILAVGAWAWVSALRRVAGLESIRTLWLGAAAAWIVAQMLETLSLHGGHYWDTWIGEMSWAEEILEMTGSALFLLALYLVSRRLRARLWPADA